MIGADISHPPIVPEGPPRQRVVIIGGGTAGWMTAAALARLLPHACTVDLIESAEIGIVGVGEATLPHLRSFIQMLGLDEAAFMAATHATYKLGIRFQDFGAIGQGYIHPFGDFGTNVRGAHFLHGWLRMRAAGHDVPLADYSLAVRMAMAGKVARPSREAGALPASFDYAYQFDATLLGPYLRGHAVAMGVTRTEGKVVAVERGADGDVTAVRLENGARIAGELFVDCSGFRSLLLGETLGAAWEDWSAWLPCDRAVAVPCHDAAPAIEPYTRATAMTAGWRWRIPLRHRVGNGYVYASGHLSDDAARAELLANIESDPLAEPRLLRFRAGRRTYSWSRNVVAIGLASGFLEPLESTSIYLSQVAILALVDHFPIGPIRDSDRAAFNRAIDYEYDRVRDFLILHYHATTRDDSSFWNHVRTMPIPESLAAKMTLFRRAGRVERYEKGLFLEPSWIAVYLGQGTVPERWDQRADAAPLDALIDDAARIRGEIERLVAAMPTHAAALR